MDLRTYLFKNKIKNKDFAKLLSVTPATVTRWVHGHPPTSWHIQIIQRYTKGLVTFNDWLGENLTDNDEQHTNADSP